MKAITIFLSAILMVCAIPEAVSAHVTVKPERSAAGSYETYTMKVPVEKDSNTTKIVLKIPEGATYESVEPVLGFQATFDSAKNVLRWEATEAGLGAGEFQQFSFIVKNPDQAGEMAWDAYQYYADGELVEWNGAADSDSPHALTEIEKNATSQVVSEHGSTTNVRQEDTSSEWMILSMALAVLSLILSLITCVLVWRLKKGGNKK
ncbi:YcnI family protein [Listeria costaricensis]|uniref:YcnI family copper-binding membrane protein n=1 Tax=Listeria costaricensis TaxID=2026604 RepID=UPI001F0989D0|nr:DUF1775 domain-containing protein [Listeria costaricensis]